jgi:hypothetical protein
MGTYKDNAYYTHQPIFIEILKKTTGNILECGCGDGSTLMIKEEIKNTNRKLVSIESNLEWFNKYKQLADDSHELYYIDAGSNDNIETGNNWVNFIKQNDFDDFEIVFIDSAPWSSRIACLHHYLNHSKIIMIHDFDYFPINNILGSVTSKETKYHNGKYNSKITCNLDDIVRNYKLFYPPDDYFIGLTGPPTLVCSNIMNETEFQSLIDTIEKNIGSYY